jgi:hypothetical protein
VTFADACDLVDASLRREARRAAIADASQAADLGAALVRLRDRLRCDGWIREFDRRSRGDGFHVLHDWDGKADMVNPDIIPIDVLDYLAAQRGRDRVDEPTVAVLLDYYYFHLLQLLSLRVWDEGDPDANLDRLQSLLDRLQDEGSGQPFVADAETLLLVATSHFELAERGYDALLARVHTLDRAHQARVALGHASSMGSHLRFGFEATYARDTIVMRRDNVADYPWLCFALLTLIREYDAGDSRLDRPAIVEALLNGLSPDARAFVGEPPESLARCDAERSEFRDRFLRNRDALLAAFEEYRPREASYSPLSFFFNFSHNIVKGIVADALMRRRVWDVRFNDLLTVRAATPADRERRIELALTLMSYAQANPDRIRGQLTPVIVYDPRAGHAAFTVTMRKLRT